MCVHTMDDMRPLEPYSQPSGQTILDNERHHGKPIMEPDLETGKP